MLDVQTGRRLPSSGEVFQIILTDGRCYAASTLAPEGNPRVSELAPDPRAARLAATIPGRQVELALRSSDGRLRVVWRAIARDDSNYLREEIELDAAQEDIGIREIVWLDDNLPGARAVR